MTFQEISREKSESVYYGRTPYVKLFSTEHAWFMLALGDVTLLAVMLRCEIDKDLNVVILGRDLSKRFRAIDVIVSLDSKEAIVEAMNGRIDNLVAAHVDGLFPQGDEQGVFDIFGLVLFTASNCSRAFALSASKKYPLPSSSRARGSLGFCSTYRLSAVTPSWTAPASTAAIPK